MKKAQMSKQSETLENTKSNTNFTRNIKINFLRIFYRVKSWNWKHLLLEICVYTLLAFIVYTAGVNFYYSKKVESRIHNAYDINTLDKRDYAIVFGAGLKPDKTASAVLEDRVQVGLDLLLAKKVDKVLLSGDGISDNAYNEPKAMKDYIEKQIGKEKLDNFVDTGVINLDESGISTLDTCKRAINNFNVHSAYAVTQDFHIVRAVTTCRLYGIDTDGVKADLNDYSGSLWFRIRDVFAMDRSVIILKLFK